jgi:hypothetical protein
MISRHVTTSSGPLLALTTTFQPIVTTQVLPAGSYVLFGRASIGPSDFRGESKVVAHCWVRYCPTRLNSVWSFPVALIGAIRSGSSTGS